MAVVAEKKPMQSGEKSARSGRETLDRPSWPRRALRLAWSVLGWVPLTPLGLGTALALGGLIRLVALPRQDQVLWTLAVGGLAYQGVAVVMVVVVGLWLRLRPQGVSEGPISAEAGSAFVTGFSPGWVAWNPLIGVELSWASAKDATVRLVTRRLRMVEEVKAAGRMSASRVERRFVVGDVAHLARVRFVRGRDESIKVRPAQGAWRPDPMARPVSGDQLEHPDGKPEGELIEIRRYSPGDPLKFVLWKLYARTGQLVVRSPERSLSTTRATRAYFVAGPDDEASAGLARAWIEGGGLGLGSAFGADGREGSAGSIEDAMDRLVHSAEARDRGGAELGAFLDEGKRTNARGGLLFVPAAPGAWLARTASAIAVRRGPFQVFVGADGLGRGHARGWASRLLTRRDAGPGVDVAGVVAVVERLAAAGAEVRVVDRASGRTFRLEELKEITTKGGRS